MPLRLRAPGSLLDAISCSTLAALAALAVAAAVPVSAAAAPAADEASAEDLDLLTTGAGATIAGAAAGGASALGLIDGNGDDQSWKIDYPRETLPATVVFELLAPTVLTAVGADNAGARPGGVAGGAAREIRFEASASGPDDGFVPLGILEVAPEERKLMPVEHPEAVRWIRVTALSDHGGGKWVYLDEVIAQGTQQPVPADDGRFSGVYVAPGDIRFELTQEGTLVQGCYTDTSGRGGGSLAGGVDNGIAHLQWIDGRNPEVAGSALFVKDSGGNLNGIWYRLPGRTPRLAAPAPTGTATPCTAAQATNPVADALAASGEAILYGIYFDFDKDVLKQESKPVLRQLLAALEAAPDLAADIEGHTDNVGSVPYNQDLSERRAQAVVAWLVEHGLAADRLAAVGKAEAEPVAANETADGRALNRRVEVRRR